METGAGLCRLLTIIRGWSAIATALLSAVVGDVLTESLANHGFLGAGSIRDTQHESLRPVAVVAALVLIALAIFSLAQRIRLRDVIEAERIPLRSSLVFGAVTLAATFAVVLLMEGYETRFGGDTPFDPHSVLVAHAPFVLAAYVLTTLFVKHVVHACLGLAVAAGHAAASVIVNFICVDRSRVAATSPRAIVHFAQLSLYRALDLAYGIHGFRAPPAFAAIPAHYST